MNEELKDFSKKKPIFIIKPSLINGIMPLFLKNLIKLGLIGLCLFLLLPFLNMFFSLYKVINAEIIILIIILLSILFISIKTIMLIFTKYYFFENTVVKEFKFIIIKRRSVIYNRITNITLKISLWDRLTNAGNITLHTGDDEMPDVVLKYVKNPIKIEEKIYALIHKKNNTLTHKIIN